jgi:hypothetical protein
MPNGKTLMNPKNFKKHYNSCAKIIKIALYHCQIIFSLHHKCTNRYQPPTTTILHTKSNNPKSKPKPHTYNTI